MLAHKDVGYSAFVVTDHIYPSHREPTAFSFNSVKEFKEQKHELEQLSKYLDYPYIQGIELNIGFEEVLVFNNEACIFILEKVFDKTWEYSKEAVMDILEEAKNIYNCAVVLCHPSLDSMVYNYDLYKRLFKLLDGVEIENNGYPWFEENLKNNNIDISKYSLWKNTDAHWIENIEKGSRNLFNEPIINEEQLIQIIKRGNKDVG
jgi:hypothetical protein